LIHPTGLHEDDEPRTWPPPDAPRGPWKYAVTRASFGAPLDPPHYAAPDAEAVAMAASDDSVTILWRW